MFSMRNCLGRMTRDNLTKIVLRNDSLFELPPYALDRSHFSASQPLIVIFEKSVCKECDKFHAEVLALEDIRNTLKKFEIVRLDADDISTPIVTPKGKQVTPSLWYKQTSLNQVPAMLFFDETGAEILKTDALVFHQRMMNSLNYVLEQAYKKNWTYQRFARAKAIEKARSQDN